MPITPFQREIFAILRRNRSPESYVMGAFVDAIHLHQTYLSLGALAWAAAGKDEGLNPRLILDLAERFARYRQSEIDSLHLAKPLSLPDLKARWTVAVELGRSLVETLPAEEVGCLYLDPVAKKPVNPDPADEQFPFLLRHRGSVGGGLASPGWGADWLPPNSGKLRIPVPSSPP